MSDQDYDDDDDLDDDIDDDDSAPWAGASDGGNVPPPAAPRPRRQAAPAPANASRRSPRRGGVTAQRTASGGSDVENVTRRVVDRFTCEGFLFTALDISNAVKQSLPGVRHREVAPIVRDLFEDGIMGDDYVQTLIDVQISNGQTVQAFLYHMEDDDPDDYAGTQRQQQAIPPIPVQQLVHGGAPATEVTVEIGKDNRARIPRDFLERNGLTSGTIHVEQAAVPQTLLLREPASAAGPALAVLGFTHPTLLYVPVSVLQGFDLTKPVVAKPDPSGVLLVGA